MAAVRKSQVTLAKIMVLIAGLAVIFAAARNGAWGFAIVIVVGWGTLAGALAFTRILDWAFGATCPRCGRFAMRLFAVPFTIRGYFECAACGARFKRWSMLFFWEDASGPEDAGKFRRKSADRKWLGYAVPDVVDTVTCSGKLLRSKRLRGEPLSPVAAEDPNKSQVPAHDESPGEREGRAPRPEDV